MSDRIQIVINFIDKVSFAGIFNKLFHPLIPPLTKGGLGVLPDVGAPSWVLCEQCWA